MEQPADTIYQQAFWDEPVLAHSVRFQPPEDDEEINFEIDLDEVEKFKFHDYVLTPERVERLKFFARINPSGFRRIWLNFQYQQYKLRQSFQEAKHSADDWISNQLTNRTIASPAKRNQVLKTMTISKQKSFLEFYTKETALRDIDTGESYTFNILAEAAFADIESLFYPDEFALQFISPMLGNRLKLDSGLWNIILSDNFVDMGLAEVLLPGGISGFKGLEEHFNSYRHSGSLPSMRPPGEFLDRIAFADKIHSQFTDYDIEF